MLKYRRKRPSTSEFWECRKYTCYYYFEESLDSALKFIGLKSLQGDDNWYLSYWKDNVKTVLSGPKLKEKKSISPLVKVKELTEVRPLTQEFNLLESIKKIAGGE